MRRLALAALLACLSFPAFAACPTYTTIADVGNVPLQTGVLVTVPPTGGANPGGLNNVSVKVGLSTAIKEETGHTLFLAAQSSVDSGATWQDVASINWVSYGHQLTVHCTPVDTLVDPDPALTFPVNAGPGQPSRAGAIFRLQYQTNDLTTAHPIFGAN